MGGDLCVWPRTWSGGDAAGDVGVFVEVVAGADAVVAIGDLQGNCVGGVSADEQDWGECFVVFHFGQIGCTWGLSGGSSGSPEARSMSLAL